MCYCKSNRIKWLGLKLNKFSLQCCTLHKHNYQPIIWHVKENNKNPSFKNLYYSSFSYRYAHTYLWGKSSSKFFLEISIQLLVCSFFFISWSCVNSRLYYHNIYKTEETKVTNARRKIESKNSLPLTKAAA